MLTHTYLNFTSVFIFVVEIKRDRVKKREKELWLDIIWEI